MGWKFNKNHNLKQFNSIVHIDFVSMPSMMFNVCCCSYCCCHEYIQQCNDVLQSHCKTCPFAKLTNEHAMTSTTIALARKPIKPKSNLISRKRMHAAAKAAYPAIS